MINKCEKTTFGKKRVFSDSETEIKSAEDGRFFSILKGMSGEIGTK
jgi:hypothetical protein